MKKQKLEASNSIIIDAGIDVWKPTNNLRFVYKDMKYPKEHWVDVIREKTLQQMWISNLGKVDWRDIELVNIVI